MVEEDDQNLPPPKNCISSDWMPSPAGDQPSEANATGKASNPTNAEDLQSAKMEALGRLAAGIAHEINTPAQFVGDHLKFIQDSIKEILRGPSSVYLPNHIKDNLPLAIKNTIAGINRIGNVVATMRRFSHKGLDKQKARGDINQAIRDALFLSRTELDKDVVELRFSLGKDIPEINCSLSDISHVILSLIVNAYDSIADKVKDGEKGTITIRSFAEDKGVRIEIRDNGRGIPASIKDRIFEPFFTTKVVGQGMGQGLSIAHAVIVAEHGGKLVFETEVGKGSSFEIFLPLNPES
jgi:two-component system, NtrC family, sensor kinase